MSAARDLYELLGVPRDAPPADIRWAYEREVNRAHRDGAHRHMADLSLAFDTLSDPRRRHTYDRHGLPALRERSPGAAPLPPPWRIVKRDAHPGARHNVVPAVGRARSRARRPTMLAVFGLGAVAGLLLALQVTGAGGEAEPDAPPGQPVAEQQVLCDTTPAGQGYIHSTPAGAPVACSNGAVPQVLR